jgi:PAS domain S-box-containing protein
MEKDSKRDNQNSETQRGICHKNDMLGSSTVVQKEPLKEIDEAEARYQALFERSIYCVYIHDLQGRFLDANEAALRLLEYKREEINSLNFVSLLDESQIAIAYQRIRALIEKGSSKVAQEYRLITKSGKNVWVETDASVIYRQGKPYAVQGVAKDITARKRAEEALRESEERYRALFNDSRDAIFITTRDGRFLEVNSSFLELFGYTRAELDTIHVSELYANPPDREKFQRRIEKEGSLENYQIRARRKDGTTIECLLSSALRQSSKDGILGYQGIIRNITEQKRAQEALRDSEAHYRAIVDAFDGLIYICSQDYRVEFMNQRFIERTGYDPTGELCYKAMHGLDSVCEWCVNEQVLKGETVRWEVQSPKDQHWYYIVSSPIYHAGGKISKQSMILDITDRKRMEDEIKDNAEKIKLFAYSVSHDLKNPAISTHGLAKRLHKHYGSTLDENGRKYCNHIMKASEQISDLVGQINLYISSKETPSKIEAVDLNKILALIQEEFSAQIKRRQIDCRGPAGLPSVNADRLGVIRILRNLVDNALKYGGEDLSEIEIGYKEAAEHHILSVKDNGVGIAEDDSKSIFGIFMSKATSEGIQGTGLGLAIVKEIAERHRGSVWADPGKEKGITFHVSLSKHLPLIKPK